MKVAQEIENEACRNHKVDSGTKSTMANDKQGKQNFLASLLRQGG